MSYRTILTSHVRQQLLSWQLPDTMLVEAHLRLREEMPLNPSQTLIRATRPFDGLQYRFAMIDPDKGLCEHYFIFHVVFGQDEETLVVLRGSYWRRVV